MYFSNPWHESQSCRLSVNSWYWAVELLGSNPHCGERFPFHTTHWLLLALPLWWRRDIVWDIFSWRDLWENACLSWLARVRHLGLVSWRNRVTDPVAWLFVRFLSHGENSIDCSPFGSAAASFHYWRCLRDPTRTMYGTRASLSLFFTYVCAHAPT